MATDDIYALRSKQREQTIRILSEAGADVRVERQAMHGVSFKSVLGSAIKWGSGDIIRYLVERGSDMHEKRPYRNDAIGPYRAGGDMVTLLHKAAHVWNADGMQALLALGADVSAEDQSGRQPLHWAVLGKYFQDNRYR